MLTQIDRLQLAVPDRNAAAAGWMALLGAQPVGEQRIACLAARSSRYRLGRGWIELLEPDGAGPVADAVARRGGHLFAAGAATDAFDALVAHLRRQGVEPVLEGGRAYLDPASTGGGGLRVVLSPDEALDPVGDVAFLYEVTLLVRDVPAVVDRFASLFGLAPRAFVPIESKQYGYTGTLTLFDCDRLDRIEVITPNQPGNSMGRFFSRVGEAFYMAFAESGALAAIEERARERGDGFTVVPPTGRREGAAADTIFVHPPALGGTHAGALAADAGLAVVWPSRARRGRAVSPTLDGRGLLQGRTGIAFPVALTADRLTDSTRHLPVPLLLDRTHPARCR